MMKNSYKKGVSSIQSGFTLLEVIVVIAILAILSTLVIAAINPLRQIAQANNAKRQADVATLFNAIYQFVSVNNGAFPPGITTTEQEIAQSGADLCAALVPEFIAALPLDPLVGLHETVVNCASDYHTGYTIKLTGSGSLRITITAPSAQNSETISVTQ